MAGLKQQVAAGHSRPSPDGLSAQEVLDRSRARVLQLQAALSDTYLAMAQELADEKIRIVRYQDRPERQRELRQQFLDQIFPVLTPLAVDPSHPFPYISDLSLSMAVTVRDPETGERRFARIKVPPVLPRLWEVGTRTYILLEQIIAANLDILFPGMEVVEHHLFRVTRNADLDIEEDEADDLLLAIEEELRKRRFGKVVRLEVERSMPPGDARAAPAGPGPRGDATSTRSRACSTSRALNAIADLDIPHLQPTSWQPVTPPRLVPADEDEEVDVFAAMRDGRPAGPPPVRVVRAYRPAVHRAGRRGPGRADHQDDAVPHVAATRPSCARSSTRRSAASRSWSTVEIKARFDERANIVWARALERAGAHVAYGVVGLKTHCKAALVIRREGRGLRSYVHLGTGNYNPKTARIYTDLGLFTDDLDHLRGRHGPVQRAHGRRPQGRLSAAARGARGHPPGHLGAHRRGGRAAARARRRAHRDEDERARGPGHHRRALRGQQGRRGDRPHHPGHVLRAAGQARLVGDRSRVRSVVGRYLEHSRIYAFGRGERERFLHRLGGHDGAQPGPSRGDAHARRWSRCSRTGCGRSSR